MAKSEIDVALAHRLLTPGPVVLVTSQAKGRFNIHAAPWAMPISLRPPLVAVAVPPERLTHDLIRRTAEFVINIPSVDLAKQVKQIGAVSGYEVDKLKVSGLRLAEPKAVGVPLIEECIGHLECGLRDALEGFGDHTLFVGEVLAAWAESEAFEGVWKLEERELKPLHFLGGERYSFLDAPIESNAKAKTSEQA